MVQGPPAEAQRSLASREPLAWQAKGITYERPEQRPRDDVPPAPCIHVRKSATPLHAD